MTADSALMPTYGRYPLRLVRGEGTRVWDERGSAYLDFAGGIAAMPLGHSHPAWIRAVTDQAASLTHVSNLFSTEPQEQLAARLAALSGLDSVFLANSGAEANEAALKIARKHGLANGGLEVVALEGSFHGRTFATLAATGQPHKHAPFAPLPGGFVHVPPGDAEALGDAVGPRTAAILLEPVLGEGGILPLEPEYLAEARRLCDEHGALLMLDEVQTGVGRCGSWFAFQRLGVTPDVVTLAKGLGGGLPIGACLSRVELAFGPGEHASTFGGGPVPSAGALAVLSTIEAEGLIENCLLRGQELMEGLAESGAAGLAEVRGMGLLIGAEFVDERAGAVVRALIDLGFLATEAGPRVVRFAPPLSVTAEEAAKLVAAFPLAARSADGLARAAS
ncbi:MAG TPA: acetylornithine transaminase [Actinomycetota bacterium]|nr:acetylornithine transaminase [Actinomycetota bacterium]